jgi:tetratricopeptide (TPR) repeat protein
MIQGTKLWVSLSLFLVVFGLAVFGITRNFYMKDASGPDASTPAASQSRLVLPEGITESDVALLGSSSIGTMNAQDPAEISRRADEFFANRQYDQAAAAYERLLAFAPNNVEILNNLGLTLHYLGRSDEALRRLNDGVAIDPEYQRIWLTLGFVNSQLGNIEQARNALTAATRTGSDESIRQSATNMLEKLP